MGAHDEVEGTRGFGLILLKVKVGFVDLTDELGAQVALDQEVGFLVQREGQHRIVDYRSTQDSLAQGVSGEVCDLDLDMDGLAGLVVLFVGDDLEFESACAMAEDQALCERLVGIIKEGQAQDAPSLEAQRQLEALWTLDEVIRLLGQDSFALQRDQHDALVAAARDDDVDVLALGACIIFPA